jgi:hypothetical protein
VKIIFGDDPNPQREFNFVDLSKTFPGYTFNPFKPGKEKSMYLGEPPSEGGYVWVYGMDSGDVGRYWESKHVFQKTSHERLDEMRHMYRVCLNQDYDEVHPELVKQYQQMNPLPVNPNYAWPVVDEEHKIVGGMFGNVGLFDVASLHPSSLEAMQFFGPKYTKRFSEIKNARIDIKHKNLESAKKRMNGAFADLIKSGEDTKGLAGALKIVINSVYGLTSASFPTKCNDVASGVNDRNKDNKVAKRGALFMILLKQMVLELGYTAVHVKTDSIKVADADVFITAFINDMGKHYGYDFEHEATYDRMCIVNRSTYIAYEAYGDDKGKWMPTGTQFLQPYVLKTLFRKEALEFKDLAETKQVKTCIYLDFNEDLPEGEHHYDFVGKISAFTPVKPGCGGGLLMRESGEDSYAAVTGTKGYRWKESSVLRALGKEDQVDMRYYEAEAQDAIEAIRSYGDYDWFVDIASPYISPSKESNDYLQYLLEA